MIDPRALRTFLAICNEGSISGAARQLAISQPSVSVTIARLEQTLNVSLFSRSRAGIVLTAEGDALRRRAEAMDTLLRDAESEIALVAEGIRGPLRIGGTPGALVSLLPKALDAFGDRHGRYTLHILERPDRELTGMLRKGEIELALVTTGLEEVPEDIEEIGLAEDPFALIVGKRYDHLPSEVSLADTIKLDWVLPQASGGFRRQIDALFTAASLPIPRDVIYCDSLLTTKSIVRTSRRVTILPRGVAAAELSMGVLRAVTLTEADFSRRIGTRRWKGAPLSQMGANLMAILGSTI